MEKSVSDIDKAKIIKHILKIIFYVTIFLLNWVFFERVFGLAGIYLASLNISIIFFTVKLIYYLGDLKEKREKFDFNQFKKLLKSEFQWKYVIYAILSNFYFITIYLFFSFSYPFAFMWPSNLFNNFTAAWVAFPIYFSLEILYRKVIYPQLNFLKTERKKSLWIIIIAIYIQINLMALTSTWAFFPSVMFMYLAFLYVIIQNTLIYEHTKSFSTVILSSFNIIQLFFAVIISNAIGIGTALHLFVKI